MADTETRYYLPPVDSPAALRRRRLRMGHDRLAAYAIRFGGVAVIIAITLIFVYLLAVVFPMFLPADARPSGAYPVPGGDGTTLYLAIEEQAEIGLRVSADGRALFFATDDGRLLDEVALPLPPGVAVTAVGRGGLEDNLLGLGLDDGRVLVFRHSYEETYPDDRRVILPRVEFPLGEQPLEIDDAGRPLARVALRDGEEQVTVAGWAEGGDLVVARFLKTLNLLDESIELERFAATVAAGPPDARLLLLDYGQRWLYVLSSAAKLTVYDLEDLDQLRVNQVEEALAGPRAEVTAVALLLGGISLLVGDDQGVVAQWFPVRDDENRYRLTKVREFAPADAAVTHIAPEFRRRGFLVGTETGGLAVYHSTADRRLLEVRAQEQRIDQLAVSPRGDAALLQLGDRLQFWHIDNEHPEVSLSALWSSVWYEGYEEPELIWQSSAATNDFEPKFSIVPLAFGTIKAAAYAMMVAIPLAILGAIYTAYFMAPRLRQAVKPTIEIMEALPTVILGFLAGLWLAPFVEEHLPGVFSVLLVLPLTVLGFGMLWHHGPTRIRLLVPEGWRAALLIPVVVFAAWLSIAISPALEQWLFAGDMRQWLTSDVGIGFDQRNAIVVGIAMGFAVVPTIFSITEDAIFSVPRHLVHGSLALGATPWQALVTVVMPTSSPAIFSAVMMGFGRAVGETMIVLMATGNTAVLDFSIFQGMRTLSANIAVEMPESEVGSTHYRVLFLTALVLFMFTFVFNTGAEIVRQRLRRRYATL